MIGWLTEARKPDVAARITGGPQRRSVPRLLLGVVLVVGCAIGGIVVGQQLGHRESVLVLARSVATGQVLSAQDLREASVSVDSGITVIPVDDEPRVIGQIKPEPGPHHPAASPYWADLVSDSQRVGDTEPALRTGGWSTPAPDRFGGATAGADLVLTSLRPEHSGDRAGDRVALAAARLLRTGGILVVLTHCDWSQGQLIDPTGPVVAAAQNADLLYLQHIVVVHAPVHDGEFMIEPEAASPEDNPRPRPRTQQPATHRRIHTDLLVFAQPHDHNPPPVPPATSAHQAGPLR